MTTRAKFKCVSKTQFEHCGSVRLQPVMDGSEENKQFWTATPSGSIDMQINTDAINQFEVGQSYYVDFSPADVIESAA